jgi:hypothetical protein
VLLEGKDGFCWFCYCDRGRCGFCWFHHCGWGRIWLRRRLQLGEWLNSFLVAVGAGHGSVEVTTKKKGN